MSRDPSRSSTLFSASAKRDASPRPPRPPLPAQTSSSSTRRRILRPFLLADDYRGRLPLWLSRFTGYRPPGSEPPYDPLPFPPFCWLVYLPLKVEVWIFAFTGSFISILLIEALMSTHTVFADLYHSPVIITSFGASAVLVFGVIESPLAQPKNLVGGHFVAALLGTAITRLFLLDPSYQTYLDDNNFHTGPFFNGALSVAISLAIMLMMRVTHPPAGATALNAAVLSPVVTLSWRYLPVIIVSSIVMLAWALIINNLGRRRYPVYWWAAQRTFVRPGVAERMNDEERALRTLRENPLRVAEDGGRTGEALLEERVAGEGFHMEEEGDGAEDLISGEAVKMMGILEPRGKVLTGEDRRHYEGR